MLIRRNLTINMEVFIMCIFIMVACCLVAVSATDRSIVQSSPTECGMSKCVISNPQQPDGLGPSNGVAPHEKKIS